MENYIAGLTDFFDTKQLLDCFKYAGINVKKEGKQSGVIFPHLKLMYFKANRKQLSILKQNHFPPLFDFIEKEETYETLNAEQEINAQRQDVTWGIDAIGATASKYTGEGIKVALLDTGIDSAHPDFNGVKISTASFIEGESAHDGNGHGTHCAGIILGNKNPETTPRYGISPAVELFAGKVLKNSGAAHSRYVFKGIEWALQNECKIISISLGTRVRRGVPYSLAFEKAAKIAIEKGALIIAAAGNDSYRDLQRLLPVSEPANCPSVMAVGAIDKHGTIYRKSNAGLNENGGKIDLVAPGVSILSSYTKTDSYKYLSGTSMATSFVTGIAAQYMEAFPSLSPNEIRAEIVNNVRKLSLPERDAGAGLIQAL